MALASWTPGGFVGELFAIQAALVPPPLDLPDPLRWGDPDVVGEWFEGDTREVRTEVRRGSLGFAHTPGGTVELFRAAHWTRHRRATAAGTEVEAEFLEVSAARR